MIAGHNSNVAALVFPLRCRQRLLRRGRLFCWKLLNSDDAEIASGSAGTRGQALAAMDDAKQAYVKMQEARRRKFMTGKD